DPLRLREDVSLHRGERFLSAEGMGQIRAVGVECVHGEVIVVEPFVVPGRAGAVITSVLPLHLLVSAEPAGVVVASRLAERTRPDRLPTRRDAVGHLSLPDLPDIRRDVHEHPMVEVHPGQVVWYAPALLVDVVTHRRDVWIVADDGERLGAGWRVAPAEMWVAVLTEGDVLRRVRNAQLVPVRDRRTVGKGFADQLHLCLRSTGWFVGTADRSDHGAAV